MSAPYAEQDECQSGTVAAKEKWQTGEPDPQGAGPAAL